MQDLIFLAIAGAFFALTFGIIELCERLTEVG